MSTFIRKLVNNHHKAQREKELKATAQTLLDDYQTKNELTAFTALDGEDVL